MQLQYVQMIAEYSAGGLEVLGVAVIVLLVVHGIASGAYETLIRRSHSRDVFDRTRQRLIRGILLGLELLVAADIIHTVAVDLTWSSVGVLAVIVAIRTFLSFTLEVEMTGKWPWQQDHPQEGRRAPGARNSPGDS